MACFITTSSISKTQIDIQKTHLPFSKPIHPSMAAKFPISSSSATSLPTKLLHIPLKPSSFQSICPPRTNPPNHNNHFKLRAKLGGEDSELGKDGKKKFITKEQEPEQYWQTAGEREGENPMKTPLPYIIIFGMSTPFIILAIAFLNGWIKAPIR